MTSKRFEVAGIGNAIVDVIATGKDEFLKENNIIKGAMNLIDEERAELLYSKIGPARELSGGSAGNTMAGFASLGGKGAYIGKVAKDQLGQIFAHDMRAGGIHFESSMLEGGPATARSFIIVTDDGERSMNTYLGACTELTKADIDAAVIENAGIVYMEGYLFDKPQAKEAYLTATKMTHAAGGRTSLTLSDTFCVERHREDFQRLVENETDILFANEAELIALYQSASFEDALANIRTKCGLVAVTRSEKGSVVVCGDRTVETAAFPVEKLVDTTGAGDQYAAGFLFGIARNMELGICGQLGCLAAAEVISHIGPRPETALDQLAATTLGLKLAA